MVCIFLLMMRKNVTLLAGDCTLTEIKAIGCIGEGVQCIWNFFEIENNIDWGKAGALNMNQYVSFEYKTKQGTTAFMGRQPYVLG